MWVIIVFLLGMLAGSLLQFGGETAVDIIRGRRELKKLRQKIAVTQAEQLKQSEATTM